jgi:hypothetical protein
MTRPAPLGKIASGPFRVQDALVLGATRARLTRTDLTAPIHGVRAPAGTSVQVVEAVSLVLRSHQFISHTTAAQIWGAPLPSRLDGDLVHVSSIGDAPIMRRPQVAPHRVRWNSIDLRRCRGYVVSGPAQCWYECAAMLDVTELVVLGDWFVGPVGLATIDELAAAIRPRGRHVSRSREALALVRTGSESPMETRMRLAVIDAGFPEPEVNVEVRDGAGRFLGRVDLAWPELRIALEYDGDHHRDRDAFRRDQRRSNGFSVNEWIVIHATALDAARPAVVFERLRQAFEQRRVERHRRTA